MNAGRSSTWLLARAVLRGPKAVARNRARHYATKWAFKAARRLTR